MAGECGESCERNEAGREKTEGSRPVMATCSPRVGITLAGARQARFRRLYICQLPQARPANAMAYVDGSGTATGLARRKPKPMSSIDGSPLKLRCEDDTW